MPTSVAPAPRRIRTVARRPSRLRRSTRPRWLPAPARHLPRPRSGRTTAACSGIASTDIAVTSPRAMYRFLYWLVLSRLPAEGTHRVSFALLRALVAVPGMRALVTRWLSPRDPILRVSAFGRELPGPLGLAAGFDKDAEGIDALLALGFGFV